MGDCDSGQVPFYIMIKKILNNKLNLALAGLIVFSAFLFRQTFFAYFSQDDFFHFKLGQADNLTSFLHFFSLKSLGSIGFYRPLTVQVYSFLGQVVFGLNCYLYHLFNFLIFSLTILVIFNIFKKLFKNNGEAFLATIIYAVSSFHFTTLSFLWGIEELLTGLFYFLTVFFYLKKSNWSLFFFILALLSRETAITLPLVIFLFEFIRDKNFKKVWPFFVVLTAYLGIRWWYKIIPDKTIYLISFSPKVIFNNYFWFLSWGIGAPENLIDFISFPKINPRFFETYPFFGKLELILLAIIFWLIFVEAVKLFGGKKQKDREKLKLCFFFAGWFLITLLPFVFLVNHRFAFYLEIPFFGLAGFLSPIFFKTKLKWFFLSLYLGISLLTVNFYSKFYWGVTRAKIAHKILINLKNEYPVLPKNASLFFLNDKNYSSPSVEWGGTSTQAKHALSGCNGPSFVYQNDSLRCYFEDFDKPSDFQDNIYKFTVILEK